MLPPEPADPTEQEAWKIQPACPILAAIMHEQNGWLNRAKPNAYTLHPIPLTTRLDLCMLSSDIHTVYRALHDRQSEALKLPPDSARCDNALASHNSTNLLHNSDRAEGKDENNYPL